ncbi:MAG TPA: ATP-binding protein [Candidatus Blautia merdavium]|uniref:ATP-binding protein n=1 Tax=Candidatus Blautia merdavium TaxID=2838494 RepID=A0A9D2PP20_9FIRM|nr:ATP-binding protein [Candidatus Blautia merdavium]
MFEKEQIDEVKELISFKQEGSYWDFKREWYSEGKLADLLHDIICMANNLENRDAYIIIGIDEESDYCVRDVFEKHNRKNTQMLVDFLRDKKFAGGIRPRVVVEPLQLAEGTIDIIVIKNGYYTPYYLEEKYRDVNANNIYVRVFDTNTPKNRSADISHIELLWKKRFHLLSSPLEQVFYYLLKKDEWSNVPDDSSITRQYYKYCPEYIIEHFECDDRNGYEYYLFSQTDCTPHWYNIYVRYYQTTLFSTIGVALDGGRYFTNVPCTEFLFSGVRHHNLVSFKYFIKGSKEMILHDFFYDNENSEARYAKDCFEECILLFYTEEEKEKFKDYAISKWGSRDKYLKDIHIPYMELPDSYRPEAFKEDYENALILKKLLDEFRTY